MSASRKKVVVRRLKGTLHHGYLPAAGLLTGEDLELLLPDGRVASLPLAEVKHVAYVRNFNLDDPLDPERIGPRTLTSKPRGGLWARVEFVDGDLLDGLLYAGLPLLDSLIADRGLFLDLPDKNSNTQRLFIPRSALAGFHVLTASSVPAKSRSTGTASRPQPGLFDNDSEK